ncbi:hypothetical protein [Haloechinothrix halophila]|nr:hypothetical protein [Haloechinothrix halophila]
MAQLAGMVLIMIISAALFGLEAPGVVLLARAGVLFVVHVLLSEPHATR